MALDPHLANSQFAQVAASQLRFYTHSRNDRDASFHLDESFDALNGGEFQIHSQRNAMSREHLYYLTAVRRFDDVRDKAFFSERGDVHFAPLGQFMAWPTTKASESR